MAGADVAARIKPLLDDRIMNIVKGWPTAFDPARARALGFTAEGSFREIIETYIADDLPLDTRQS